LESFVELLNLVEFILELVDDKGLLFGSLPLRADLLAFAISQLLMAEIAAESSMF